MKMEVVHTLLSGFAGRSDEIHPVRQEELLKSTPDVEARNRQVRDELFTRHP
jgi:hypothetical protein